MPQGVLLAVRGLAKRFGKLAAVTSLDLDVREGEILGFLGPNGAGKTTTLRMMCGLLRPDAGTIEIDGRPLRPGDPASMSTVGVSPQDVVIWDMLTCLEQLSFMGRMYGMSRRDATRRGRDLLDALGLSEKAGKLGKTLSGGMKRRLNIALGLVHSPRLLFLDEPQAGLDPQSRVLVRDYLSTLRGRTTVVITTHDMEEAEKLSDRVCIIDRGRKLVLDTVEGIKGALGEGDVFSVRVAGDPASVLVPHLPPAVAAAPSLSVKEGALVFTSAAGADMLGVILGVIRDRGLLLEHVNVRRTTLEDVFIHLTGRGLRE